LMMEGDHSDFTCEYHLLVTNHLPPI
jgi:hypothetical protein